MTETEKAFKEAVAQARARATKKQKPRKAKAKPRHWLAGRKVVDVRRMTPVEMETEGWYGDAPTAIVFDDGTIVYPSQDDEGNNAGAMFGTTMGEKGQVQIRVM